MDFKFPQFDGPLDLLLQLIEEQKMDITEVNLAEIADRYVERIRQNGIGPEELANFLVIAAKLLLIKSKTLLPYLIREEEEQEIKDFENQLKIYKDFLEASKKIENMLGERRRLFAREFNKKSLSEEKFFYPPKNVTVQILKQVFKEIAGRLKVEEKLAEDKIIKAINIEEKMSLIQNLLTRLQNLRFGHVLENAATRVEIIVSFLAMLEMIKQRSIFVQQSDLFAEIEIMNM
jgi:segregation and condensation protein A